MHSCISLLIHSGCYTLTEFDSPFCLFIIRITTELSSKFRTVGKPHYLRSASMASSAPSWHYFLLGRPPLFWWSIWNFGDFARKLMSNLFWIILNVLKLDLHIKLFEKFGQSYTCFDRYLFFWRKKIHSRDTIEISVKT